MNLGATDPAPGSPRGSAAERASASATVAAANRTPAKDLSQAAPARATRSPTTRSWSSVVALAAVGILMVYSSSAMKALPLRRRRHVRDRRARRSSGRCSASSRWSLMMRVDYRYLRLASVRAYVVALGLLCLVFVPEFDIVDRRVGALAQARPAAGDPPGRDRQARADHLSRPLVRQARRAVGDALGRCIALPDHRRARDRARLPRARPGHDDRHRASRRSRCSSSPAPTSSISARCSRHRRARRRSWSVWPATRWSGIRVLLNPWADPQGAGYHTVQGLLALGLGGIFGSASARAGWPAACSCPTRSTTSSSRSSARSSG